mmetsp:Transcript_74795/g.136661  ORF Transcript_74795/g.136661 Transcript_74795/m.136661 type:complete len:97 (-) Transcript_74795:1083-1373(-)
MSVWNALMGDAPHMLTPSKKGKRCCTPSLNGFLPQNLAMESLASTNPQLPRMFVFAADAFAEGNNKPPRRPVLAKQSRIKNCPRSLKMKAFASNGS